MRETRGTSVNIAPPAHTPDNSNIHIVPAVPTPRPPSPNNRIPVPQEAPDRPQAGAAMPAAAPTPQMPVPASVPTRAAPSMSLSPAELAVASSQMYQEPGNPFSAFAQGVRNTQALRAQNERELELKRYEEQKAKELTARQVKALRAHGYEEMADLVESGAIDAKTAVIEMNKDRREKAKTGQSNEVDMFGLPKKSAASQRIRLLMAQGIDPQIAAGIVSGRIKDHIDPATGSRALIDLATKKIIPLDDSAYDDPAGTPPGDPTEAPVETPSDGQPAAPEAEQPAVDAETDPDTIYGQADDMTGAWTTGRSLWNSTVGQAVPELRAKGVTAAQTDLKLFQREMVRTLAINPRVPVYEQKRIEDLLQNGTFTGPEDLRDSMIQMDKDLARIEEEKQRQVLNRRTPIDVKNEARQILDYVRNARKRLGVPDGEEIDRGAETPATKLDGQDADKDGWKKSTDGNVRIRLKPGQEGD